MKPLSAFFFLYWPLQLKVRLMGHQGPRTLVPSDEVIGTQRLPEDVVLTALVISL